MKPQTILLSVALGFSLFMNGCSSKNVAVTDSGFFEDYTQFKNKTQTTIDLSQYKSIIVTPVQVISYIPLEKQTPAQKKLYTDISEYLTSEYKKIILANNRYTITEAVGESTLSLETAISTVEVHFDDKNWNQNAPIPMALNVVSFNSYMDEDVRILAEKRLVDSATKKVLTKSLNLQKDSVVTINSEVLVFENVKPALDSWLQELTIQLEQ